MDLAKKIDYYFENPDKIKEMEKKYENQNFILYTGIREETK